MSRSPRPAALVAPLLAVAAIVSGCGSSARTLVAGDPPATCRTTVMGAIERVAARAYDEVARGRVIGGSRAEVERARALVAAVATGDPLAATNAARRLEAATQIAFLRVDGGRRALVRLGQGPAIAGASGVLRAGRQIVGRYSLAVQGDAGYTAVVHGLTGAAVLVRQGHRQLAGLLAPGPADIPGSGVVRYRGVDYVAYSFDRPAYPAGSERISLLAPPSLFRVCAATEAQTVANVLGPLAMRIYAHEATSRSERTTIAYMERYRPFVDAVAAGDPAGTRAAIIAFFRSHRHIVRVRALRAGRLVTDVGGPYVLAPVTGTLRRSGRVVGRFETAIQDDAGYLALTQVYTGAQVILRVGNVQVPSSTLSPGPAAIPDRGAVAYAGRRYEAYSFNGTAFPGGTLRISLLVPAPSSG